MEIFPCSFAEMKDKLGCGRDVLNSSVDVDRLGSTFYLAVPSQLSSKYL